MCSRNAVMCMATAEEGELLEESEQSEVTLEKWRQIWDMEQYDGDNSFRINNRNNQAPDISDPEWPSKVTDWHEFWNHQKWDVELDGVDDEVDSGGNSLTSKERILAMIQGIKDNRLRADVMQWMPIPDIREHFSTWESPPVTPESSPLNPDYTNNDLRAISEKKAWRAMMDAEWRRRQDQVGKLQYPDPYADVRLAHFGKQVTDLNWSERRVYNLITLGGTAAKPEDHGAFVENPLIPIDYVQTMGVNHVEETEDFLERIGHLATPDDEENFEEEIIFDALGRMGLNNDDLLNEVELDDMEGDDNEDEDEQEEVDDTEDIEEAEDGDGF